jgi:hypothetical protein
VAGDPAMPGSGAGEFVPVLFHGWRHALEKAGHPVRRGSAVSRSALEYWITRAGEGDDGKAAPRSRAASL